MQLREAETLRMLDHHHRGVGNVYADLNHGSCHKHIDLAALEPAHDHFLFVGVEAAMQKSDAQSGKRASAQLFVHRHGGLELGLLLFFGAETPGKRSAVLPLRMVFPLISR